MSSSVTIAPNFNALGAAADPPSNNRCREAPSQPELPSPSPSPSPESSPSSPSPSPESSSPSPEPSPPSYQQAQISATTSNSGSRPVGGGMWVGIQCSNASHPELKLAFNPRARTQRGAGRSNLPKVPEFYQALSKFDEAHSTLQDHVKKVCDVTKTLFDLQDDLSKIHEYWMEVGMHDVAHDVIPLLDRARGLLPQSTFVPTVQSPPPIPVM